MNHSAAAKKQMDQLVTFRLGREYYGIDIFSIQEVLHFQAVTRIPNAPEFVEGVIRVRDRVIPVVDLRVRLGLPGTVEGKRRIVIVEEGPRLLGLIVDDISKVLLLDSASVETLPEAVVGEAEHSCLSSLAKMDDELVIIISPDKVLSRREKDELRDFVEERWEDGDG